MTYPIFRIPVSATSRPVPPLSEAKVAVVHEWLYTYAGAEKVLEKILEQFPNAEVFSLIDRLPQEKRSFLGNRRVHTSFLQKLPLLRNRHQLLLPLMPLAMERFNLSHFDLVVTSSYAVAKGVITGPNQLHLCYCHSPVRYAWDLQHQYLHQWRLDHGPRARAATGILHKLRIWDHVTSNGVDQFMANSRFIARRIMKTYRRKSTVVYPPVDTSAFVPDGSPRGQDYVTISRLVGYKRVDLLVDAFRQMPDRRLVVIGKGEELERMRNSAPANVRFEGELPHPKMVRILQRARAFLFAAEEDFGIAPVEAQACGIPVIAFGRGGALETIRGIWCGENNPQSTTGVFFPQQTVDSLISAIRFFESREEQFSSSACVENASRFSPKVFRREFLSVVDNSWQTFKLQERDPNYKYLED